MDIFLYLLKCFPLRAQFAKIGLRLPHVSPKCSDRMAGRITEITDLCFFKVQT